MLRPTDIASSNYTLVNKPVQGRAKRLKIQTDPAFELAALQITAANTLSVTASVPANAALADDPREVLLKLEEELRAESAVVIGVLGTDQNDAVLSGTVTFAPPDYAQEQRYVFPAGSAREAVVASGKKFKTISAYVPTTIPATAVGGKFSSFGMPDMDGYVLIGCRTQLDYPGEYRDPMAVACGGDDSAYVLPGQKPRRDVTINVNELSMSDGPSRYNGMSNLVLLAETDREDKLVTDREFLIGVTVSFKRSVPGDSNPTTLNGTGIYEDYAHLPAGPITP